MTRALSLLIIFSLIYFFKGITALQPMDSIMEATVVLGFLILAGYNVGELCKLIKLPKITGYMLTGLIFSQNFLNIITPRIIDQLRLVDHFALALIAFAAGRELKLSLIKERAKSIISITLFTVLFCFLSVFLFVYFSSSYFPFLVGLSQRKILVAAILYGVLALSKSPVTTIAIIEETDSRGPFTETILGAVILKDVIVLVVFAFALSLTQGLLLEKNVIQAGFIVPVLWKLFGSLAVGLLIGFIFSFYFRFVRKEPVFFLMVAAFFCTVVAHQLHLEVLLLAMASGFFIENFSTEGECFLSTLKKGAALIYIIFFTIAGASIDISALRQAWFITLLLIAVRLISTAAGVYIGSRLVEDFKIMRTHGWLGFINQAGVALVIAKVIAGTFPEYGNEIMATALGLIFVTDYLGPPLFKLALIKSGEARNV